MAALAVLAACGVAVTEAGRPPWWHWTVIGAVALPIAVRDRWSLIAALVTLTASVAALGYDVIPPYAAVSLVAAVALTQYSVAAKLPATRSGSVLAAGLAGAGVLAFLAPSAPLVAMPAVTLPWLVGRLVRHRRHLTERLADERAARAVAEERLRIARDLHDTVAHNLSVIAMKASIARHVAAARPEESVTALEVIEAVGREALVEMRGALGLLRANDDPDLPVGSADDVRALVDRAEQAGIRVELTLVGEAALPAGIRLVVYRVVQEALTNVIRHAKATRCTVSVAVDADAVTVDVADDGTASGATDATGYGLRGMRERVSAYGGSLHAAPRPSGGFAVAVRLPTAQPVEGGQR
ncbi:Signal transduction histidine kinase [Micromonospora citrea]|uniref:histidine kinase n=2 Tax=Micromonospora citrea TaxID=47855 RepID=A0A1C6VVC5_9ACTN|nr:Signal transduction histidine kinase [Micromonospora citrea]